MGIARVRAIDRTLVTDPSDSTMNIVQPTVNTAVAVTFRNHATQAVPNWRYQNSAGASLAHFKPGGQLQINLAGTPVASDDTYGCSIQNTGSRYSWLEILNNGGTNKGCFFGMDLNEFQQYNWQGGGWGIWTATGASDGNLRIEATNNGNVGLIGSGKWSWTNGYGGGVGVVCLGEVVTEPTSAITTGGAFYIKSGLPWYMGTVSTPWPLGRAVDVQVFTGSATWTKPAQAKRVHVMAIGGGGGGGGGRGSATAEIRCGGGGGGAGGRAIAWLEPTALGSTVTITIGGAGAAGAGGSTANGSAGGNGGNSTFGVHLGALGGNGGAGGTTTAGAGGTAQAQIIFAVSTSTASGGSADPAGGTGGAGSAGTMNAAGGGAGGGLTAAAVSGNGAAGGIVARHSGTNIAGGTGGVAADGGAGTNDAATYAASGGGGGAGRNGSPGRAGGAGGVYGTGGGGGGGANPTGGDGGTGGGGIMIVTTYF